MKKERTLIQRCRLRVKEYEEQGDHWQARPENSNSVDFVGISMENKKYWKKLVNLESKENIFDTIGAGLWSSRSQYFEFMNYRKVGNFKPGQRSRHDPGRFYPQKSDQIGRLSTEP